VDLHDFTQASPINRGKLPAAAQDTVIVTLLMHRITCQTILSNPTTSEELIIDIRGDKAPGSVKDIIIGATIIAKF